MQTPKAIQVRISDVSRGGSGVGRSEDSERVVFVPLTAPGDLVEVQILEEKKNYAKGRLIRVLEPSPLRVDPPCPVFGKCGGCEWQHIPYSLQWEVKAKGVLHALKRVGIELESSSLTVFPAKDPWHYRNRVQLRGEGHQIGFMASESQTLVPIQECEIARAELNERISSHGSKAVPAPGRYKLEIEVLPGGQVREVLNAKHAAMGFRQVNDAQNEVLRAWVRSQVKQMGATRILDLFGGSGNLSMGLTDLVNEVLCVDECQFNPEHAAVGGHVPPTFKHFRSSVARWAQGYQGPGFDLAILDPPREGLGDSFAPMRESFKKLDVKFLILVGCDADSWARDCSRFLKSGFEVDQVAALDLFPQTHHVESLMSLKRVGV